jgi:hypothetical protein
MQLWQWRDFMRFFGTIALAALALAAPAAAATTEDEQVWLNLTATGSIKGDLVYFAEVQPRIGEGVSHLNQLILRPAIGVKVTPHLTLYQGYAHIAQPIEGGPDRNEERLFQQISWTLSDVGGRGELQTRSRLEQRWLSNGDDVGWRLRQMVRFEWPLGSRKDGIAALGWAEVFVALNDTDWGAQSGYDQARGFIGAELPLPGKSTIELGYINQSVNQAGNRTRMNHIASFSLFLRH